MNNTISQIIGKTPATVTNFNNEILVMTFTDGSEARWYHEQDCCEIVAIEDVIGDWEDLIGNPLLVAEERTSDDPPISEYDEGYLWTFYTFRGIGGSVDVRWYGVSNGYYSESVNFTFTPAS